MSKDKEIRDLIIAELESNKYDWRTIDGIVHSAGLPEDVVFKFLSTNTDAVVKSTIPSIHGKDLYTTRAHFRRRARALSKLRGAFKGRLQ